MRGFFRARVDLDLENYLKTEFCTRKCLFREVQAHDGTGKSDYM